MTNEEKARELSCVNYLTKEDELLGPPEDVKIRINSYWSAMKMAEWKEKQMIDKSIDWLRCWLTSEDCGLPITNSGINEFINDFKQAMED